jgi:hypothetical protein
MTDDQTRAEMAVMPRTRRLIGGAGVNFTRSFVSYPLSSGGGSQPDWGPASLRKKGRGR